MDMCAHNWSLLFCPVAPRPRLHAADDTTEETRSSQIPELITGRGVSQMFEPENSQATAVMAPIS
jgi:hypothetical protein